VQVVKTVLGRKNVLKIEVEDKKQELLKQKQEDKSNTEGCEKNSKGSKRSRRKPSERKG